MSKITITPQALERSGLKPVTLGDIINNVDLDYEELHYFQYPSPSTFDQGNGYGILSEIHDFAKDGSWIDLGNGPIMSTRWTPIWIRPVGQTVVYKGPKTPVETTIQTASEPDNIEQRIRAAANEIAVTPRPNRTRAAIASFYKEIITKHLTPAPELEWVRPSSPLYIGKAEDQEYCILTNLMPSGRWIAASWFNTDPNAPRHILIVDNPSHAEAISRCKEACQKHFLDNR